MNIRHNITEWVSAATAISILDFDANPMTRIDYDGFQTKYLHLENPHLCFAMSQPNDELITGYFSTERHLTGNIVVSLIERNCYNEHESEEIIKDLVKSFIRNTGIVRMKIHVVKKLFASNNKATVAILIEEIVDRG